MKRIVVCCDGTWNDRGAGMITNVARLAQAVLPSAPGVTVEGEPPAPPIEQLVYYHAGVGNEWSIVSKITGGAFGRGLTGTVLDAYRFVVDNYAPGPDGTGEGGDEIYLFGFSRGAFTARSISGLIRKAGLLKKEYSHHGEEAFDIYRLRSRREDEAKPDAPGNVDGPEATAFRAGSCWPKVNPYFIGVWDTVGALGVPSQGWGPGRLARSKFGFHDQRLSRHVPYAYHALAIDEQRRAFIPTLWEVQPEAKQKVEQRWFAGVHSDVGGAYPETGLSDIAFCWMRDKAAAAGLAFDPSYGVAGGDRRRVVVAPDPNGTLHNSLSLVFRLLRPYQRQLNHVDATQSVAPEALARRDDPTMHYDPANLREYLARSG
ncbi:MAG: DUF2235 domain-containing protein [Dehalococcoidia bacterium]